MELVEGNFCNGVQSAFELKAAESSREWNAILRCKALTLKRRETDVNDEEYYAAQADCVPAPPLWQRVCGFSPKSELSVEPAERRAGIRRLLRVVERMFRKEHASEDLDKDGGPSKLDEGT